MRPTRFFSLSDKRVAAVDDPEPLEEPEVSGIVGTPPLTAVFSCEVARRLVEHHKDCVEIGWDRYDEQDRLGPYVSRILPMMREDWPVEAHTPFQQWIAAAHPRRESDLQWLLANVDSAASYDAMQVPVTWRMGASRVSRSRLRLNSGRLFLHREPLLRRSDISLWSAYWPRRPCLSNAFRALAARRILDLIVDTSAMRYRELYGFSHPDESVCTMPMRVEASISASSAYRQCRGYRCAPIMPECSSRTVYRPATSRCCPFLSGQSWIQSLLHVS